MVNTKDQSNAIVYCVCYVVCRQCHHIQRKLLGYILAHNFLDIQPIFNLFKVLESSESGLFNCINSVDIASTFWLINSLIFD